MGSTKDVRVGIYMTYSTTEMTIFDIKILCCINKECKNYKVEASGNFCSECGIKLKKDSKSISKKVSYESINENLDMTDLFYECLDGVILLNTKTVGIPSSYNRFYDDGFSYSLLDFDIKKELEIFSLQYTTQIHFLKQQLPSFKINWGVVSYWD